MTQMGARKSSGAAAASSSSSTPRTSERNVELFGEIPEGRRRKFILVEDPHRGGMRVRVRVTLDQVEMKEIPDSYRKGNSVFPRSYFPMQMQSPRPHRFPEDEDGDDVDGDGRGRDNHAKPGRGRTLVPVPTLDGTEAEVPTPRMTRTKRKKEAALNDLGYRMSWSQSRVFAGRTIFLQRARKWLTFFFFQPPPPPPKPTTITWGAPYPLSLVHQMCLLRLVDAAGIFIGGCRIRVMHVTY